MRTLFLLVVMLSVVALAQLRAVTVDASSCRSGTVTLEALPDGGCQARWCGEVTTSEGDAERACTELVVLRGSANQSRCSALLSAGAPRVLRELRFTVDAGNP